MAATAANSVSPADAYALWGERIRLLFSAPPTALETSVQQSPFERHACCVPAPHEGAITATPPPPAAPPAADGALPDEALFPACFYARLLRSQPAVPAVPAIDGASRLHGVVTRAAAHAVDEDAVATRLAARLRQRTTSDQQARLQRLREVGTGNLVAPFCDPKVEQQQALLHSELTAFLLELRRENAASLQLRHQLHYSRAVRERLADVDTPSASPR